MDGALVERQRSGPKRSATATVSTFADLKAEREKLAGANKGWANDRTALARFMEVHNLSDATLLAPVMTSEFPYRLQVFIDAVSASMVASTVEGHVSRLRTWHEAAVELVAREDLPGGFTPDLRKAIARYSGTFSSLVKAVGIPLPTLKGWYHGRSQPRPSAKNKEFITKIEAELGLPSGVLLSQVSTHSPLFKGGRKKLRRQPKTEAKRIKDLFLQVPYYPKAYPPRIVEFFQRLENFKTAYHPGRNLGGELLKRRPGGHWRTIDEKIETASIQSSFMGALFGWLMLPKTVAGAESYVREVFRGKVLTDSDAALLTKHFIGKGLSAEDIHPCHLVDPAVVGEYLQWRTKRAGMESGAHRGFLAIAISLVDPEFGLLSQCVELAWDYMAWDPVDVSTPAGKKAYRELSEVWKKEVEGWHEGLKAIADRINPDAKARDPQVLLRPILMHPNPASIISTIIERHAISKPLVVPGRKGTKLAVWCRDQLLLRMISTNPLRNRNFREMTYKADGSGNLYRKGDEWRLRFSPQDFKNERGAAKKPYDVEVPAQIHPLIEVYLNVHRPILLGDASHDEVFIGQNHEPMSPENLSRNLLRLTAGYLDQIPDLEDAEGFRSHAFRHIIATAWLKANPGDYLTVALILHDTLDTVMRNYAHLENDDGLRRFSGWIGKFVGKLDV